MNYSVSYRLSGSFSRTKKVKGVIGDGYVPDSNYPTRFLLLEDNTRIEIPAVGTVFSFSPERFALIHQRMEQQAGQAIPIRKQ